MAFEEDLTVFTSDFGEPATVAGVTHNVIMNKPDAMLYGESQVGHDFVMCYITTDFLDLVNNVAVTVSGVSYKINGAPRRLADGKFSEADLKKA